MSHSSIWRTHNTPEEAREALRQVLAENNGSVACPDCNSPRLDWLQDNGWLYVECEDCNWHNKVRFSDTRIQ